MGLGYTVGRACSSYVWFILGFVLETNVLEASCPEVAHFHGGRDDRDRHCTSASALPVQFLQGFGRFGL